MGLNLKVNVAPGDRDAALLRDAHYQQTDRLFAFDGQGKAYGWGRNNYGSLGTGALGGPACAAKGGCHPTPVALAALDGVVFEEIAPDIDAEDGGYVLRAYVDGQRLETTAENLGDWYDVDAVLRLLDAVLLERRSDQRFVLLETMDQTATIVGGKADVLRAALDAGLIKSGDPKAAAITEAPAALAICSAAVRMPTRYWFASLRHARYVVRSCSVRIASFVQSCTESIESCSPAEALCAAAS